MMQPRLLLALIAFLLFLAPAADLPVLAEAHAAAAKADDAGGNEAPPFMSLKFERLKKTFMPRFGINLLSMLVLVLAIYYPHYRKTDRKSTRLNSSH